MERARAAKTEKLRAAKLAAAKAAGMDLDSEDMQDAPMFEVPDAAQAKSNAQDTQANKENFSTPLDLVINELQGMLHRS